MDTELFAVPGLPEVRAGDDLAEATGDDVDPRFVQAVLVESTEVLFERPFLLTETRRGHVGVNAGVDRSNVPDADLLLLPERPSASAARLREALGVAAVVVTDTSGWPFRHGRRGVAVGWDGLPAGRDYRGELDRDGRELGATVESVVDELAATANLVSGGGAEGRPVVVVRGFESGGHTGSDDHFRDVGGTSCGRRSVTVTAEAGRVRQKRPPSHDRS